MRRNPMFDLSFLDAACIKPFQVLLGLGLPPMAAFLGGSAVLCLACILVGELTMAGAYYLNRGHFAKIRRDMVVNQNLSIQAIQHKDKQSYKACNKVANEAFGLSFFSGVALFAASLWPVFFAMDWMGRRFAGVEFSLPLLDAPVGFTFFFVPLYIALRVGFSLQVKPRLWPFNRLRTWMRENEDCGVRPMSWTEIMPAPSGRKEGNGNVAG